MFVYDIDVRKKQTAPYFNLKLNGNVVVVDQIE